MAISTNGTVLARLAGALYNTQMSNATYKEVAALDPSALADVLYARDFSASTDAAVATTLVTNLGLASVTGLDNWVAAQLTAAGSHKGAKVVELLNSFAQMSADTTYGAYATAFNTKVDAALALSQTTDNKGGTFAAAGVDSGATFALTASVDAIAGGTANDTINATVATLGSLDTIAGGAGTDTLNVVDSGDVLSLGGATVTGVEKLVVSSLGSIGQVAVGTTTVATREIDQLSAAAKTLDVVTYTSTNVDDLDTITVTNGTSAADTVFVKGSTGWVASAGGGAGTYTTPAAAIAAALNARVAGSASVGTDGKVYTTNDITGTAAVDAAYNVTFTDVSAGSVTALSLATQDADGIVQGGTFTVTYDGVTVTTAALASSPTVANVMTLIKDAINAIAGTTVASVVGNEVVLTAAVAGTALPTYSVTYAPAAGVSGSTFNSLIVKTDSVLNATAATAAARTSFGGTAATESVTYSAADELVASAATTANVTATAGAEAQVSGGKDVTVTAAKAVSVTGAKGAVSITTSNSSTGVALNNSGVSATAAYGAGIYVTGGSTVSVTEGGATYTSSSGALSALRANTVKVGIDSTNALNNTNGAIASPSGIGYDNAIAGLASAPTGDVTVTARTAYTDTAGKKAAAYGTDVVSVYTNGGTTVSVTGATTASAIKDLNVTRTYSSALDTVGSVGTSKLTTVNLAGISGTASLAVTSDALTDLSVVDSRSAATVAIANSGATGAGQKTLNLTVGNVGASGTTFTVSQATAQTVNVSTVASAYERTTDSTNAATAINANSGSYIALTAAEALTLNFNNANPVTLASSTLTKLATITASGAGTLDLGTVGGASSKVTFVDGSAASGAITATYSATNGTASTAHSLTFKGGAGNDVVTIAGTINSAVNSVTAATVQNVIQLGAGNDTVLLGSSGVIAAGALVDGGAGNDTVAASLLNAGNASLIQNFEVLGLDVANGTYDTDLLVGATGLSLLTSDRGNYTGVDTTQKLTISATPTLASSGSNQFTTLNFSTAVNAATSLTDSYAIEFGGVAASSATAGSQTEVNAKEVRIAGIEAVSVVSEGTGFVANAIKLDDANARTLTVTGSKDLTLTFSSNAGFGATPNTSTGIGGVSSIDASAATGVITINTTNVVGATAGLTVQTGSGNDVITLAQAATVIAGTGNDNITTTTAKATLTLGDGVDTVTVASSVVGTLSTPPTEAEVTGRVITVTDLAVGDKIDFSTNTVTAYALGLAQTTTATTLLGALNAINNATAQIAWGVYAGNTYIIWDASGTTGDVAAGDIVVKLTGIVDLSNSSISAGDILTLV